MFTLNLLPVEIQERVGKGPAFLQVIVIVIVFGTWQRHCGGSELMKSFSVSSFLSSQRYKTKGGITACLTGRVIACCTTQKGVVIMVWPGK